MEATKVLMAEHQVIEFFLDSLEAGAKRLKAGEPVRAGFFVDAAEFMKGFTDTCHRKKEEGVLFPALEAAGVPKASGPVTVLLVDHREARRLTDEMLAAAEKLEAGDVAAGRAVALSAQSYVDLLRHHIMKEDKLLFPIAERLIAFHQQAELLQGFARVERQESGEGGHEKYLDLAKALAREGSTWVQPETS